jgi:hypothetical protein
VEEAKFIGNERKFFKYINFLLYRIISFRLKPLQNVMKSIKYTEVKRKNIVDIHWHRPGVNESHLKNSYEAQPVNSIGL